MRLRHGLQADASAVAGLRPAEGGDETVAAAAAGRFFRQGGKTRLQSLKAAVESVQRHLEKLGRKERLDGDIGLLQRNAGFAGEDEELAEDVAAAQVQAGIRLREAAFLGGPHQRSEGNAAAIGT